MNENDTRVGFFCLNADVPLDVYCNPDTGEVYYVDEQDMPYLLLGVTHEGCNFEQDEEVAAADQNSTHRGVVYDGDHKWIIEGEKCYRVPADADDIKTADTVIELDYDTEYECEEDDE